MATTNTVMLYAVIVGLSCFALAAVAIWSRRDFRARTGALALSIAAAMTAWFAFTELPGKPEAMSAEVFREKFRCATIMHAEIKDRKGIFMVAKKDGEDDGEYLFVSWNLRLAASLQKSQRVAKVNGKGSIIYGGQSCMEDEEGADGKGKKGKGKKGKKKGNAKAIQPGTSGQEQGDGDDFVFHPDPVPSLPEKNYSPIFEAPLVMPERR